MQVSSQKLYAILRKAGFRAAKYNRSQMIKGWGNWSSGVQVVKDDRDRWEVSYNFGSSPRDSIEPSRRAARLQEVQQALVAAGVACYPNEHETALIIGATD